MKRHSINQNQVGNREIEDKWKKYWEKYKIYKFNSKSGKKIYSIDTPPPNISGRMHIGHAFSYAQQDFIVRFRRMFHSKEGGVFYPFGTDDNGLPTERFIEKTNNVKSKDMSRAEFISLCLKTLRKVTPMCIEDFKMLGISADYNVYYSTIDNHSRKISQKSFIELYKNKLIYMAEVPTPWCPECQTSIAQAELEDKEFESLFLTLKFKCKEEDLLIATTRPELLGACVAVFVHPDDKRYKKYKGGRAEVPLFDFEVPILEDETADMEKGTGVLMVCSYGDKYDVDAINRHKLEPRIILNKDGAIKCEKYKDLKIKDARKKIIEDLQKNNLIKEQKQISHFVNVHDKCGTEIEFIPTQQWFIKILDKKKKFIEQGKKIKWYPEFMFKRYKNWVNGLEWDWSISRDRHFGIPIPVWHCNKCKEIIFPSENELPIDTLQTPKKCKCGEIAEGETKVLDTWATSSLTPQIALSLINNKINIPMSLRPQAHEIIRTWAFYTIVRSLYSENKVPWKDIMVSGYVTLGGKKMSKSTGNVIEPQSVMERFGADALRFWAASSKLGEDLDYQEKEIIAGKKFITKLTNASKFVFMNLKNYKPQKIKLLETDKLFFNKLNEIVKDCTKSFENYDYFKAKQKIEHFFWKVFCDNYLEIVKWRVYNGNRNEKNSAFFTLYNSLLILLKLVAPITPFIAEEIYQNYYRKSGREKDKSIHISEWPDYKKTEKTKLFDLMIELLAKIRQEKSKAKKSVKAEIILSLDKKTKEKLKDVLDDFKKVINACEIREGKFGVDFV